MTIFAATIDDLKCTGHRDSMILRTMNNHKTLPSGDTELILF